MGGTLLLKDITKKTKPYTMQIRASQNPLKAGRGGGERLGGQIREGARLNNGQSSEEEERMKVQRFESCKDGVPWRGRLYFCTSSQGVWKTVPEVKGGENRGNGTCWRRTRKAKEGEIPAVETEVGW